MNENEQKEHALNENKKINTPETLEITSMDLDCSGAGMCQPEPVEAEVSDIQPAYPNHKLEKAEKRAAQEIQEKEKHRAVDVFEEEESGRR